MLQNYWKDTNRNDQTFWYVYHDTKMAQIMVQYGRPSCSSWAKSVWSSFGRTVVGTAIWEGSIGAWLEKKFLAVNAYSCTERKRNILICVCGRHKKIGWKETEHWSNVEGNILRSRFGRTNIFPWSCILGMHSKTMWNKQKLLWTITEPCSNPEFPQEAKEKQPSLEKLSISAWSYDMESHAKKCVERYCELANKTTEQLYKGSTPYIDDHQFKEEELKSVGELSDVCSQIVLKSLYWARNGRLDILWSVNKLARAITKWTRACDKRLARLISYFHCTNEHTQYCDVWNTAQQCRSGLCQDSDFAGDLEDSKSTSGGTLCIFGSHTFAVPISGMCKKQTCVSHSSTESEIISVDAGLRMDVIPALDLWDLVIDVFHSNSNQKQPFKQVRCDPSYCKASEKRMKSQCYTQVAQRHLELSNVDSVPSNVCISWWQRSCDQDDHQRHKSYTETCLQDPQSCSWLAIRQD